MKLIVFFLRTAKDKEYKAKNFHRIKNKEQAEIDRKYLIGRSHIVNLFGLRRSRFGVGFGGC